MRQEFITAARGQFQTYVDTYTNTVSTYEGLADQFGLPRSAVVINRSRQLSPQRISQMSLEELPSDVSGLNQQQRDAVDRRLTELGY